MHALKTTLLALSLAGLATSAQAASNWTGTADYTQAAGGAAADTVGPFDTYDFARGAVLLSPTQFDGSNMPTRFDGWFQSYVTNHQLLGNLASAPGLNQTYEITATAVFQEQFDAASNGFVLSGGQVELRFDSAQNRSFTADSGFTDGHLLLSGTIVAGSGALFQTGPRSVGFTDLTVRVDAYDSAVFSPATIAAGSSIFTLRLNDPTDDAFLAGVDSVLGHHYTDGIDTRLAADGYLVLQVPEPGSYAMMLTGLGLLGGIARRRRG